MRVRLLDASFDEPVLPAPETCRSLADHLAACGVAGGAVYDAVVGLAARDAQIGLITRDRRAATTGSALGVSFTVLPT